MFFYTFRADAVAKFSIRIFLDIFFEYIPITSIIPYFLAVRTDRKDSS